MMHVECCETPLTFIGRVTPARRELKVKHAVKSHEPFVGLVGAGGSRVSRFFCVSPERQ